MATETKVQQFVHKLEEGGWVKRVKFAVIVSAIIFNINLWFFRDAGFAGLSHEKGMEQAQIAREIARGNGFTTKMIRPAALWLFEKNMGKFPVDKQPDIYHAPLNPYVNAGAILVADAVNDILREAGKKREFLSWLTYDKVMTLKTFVYAYDRLIAGVQVLFFLLAVGINYFTARRLFDDRLAALAACMMLVCQRFWEFAVCGLPQMLMLFLFSAAAYTLVRAVEAKYHKQSPLAWLSATAVLFGLLALTHGLTIWMFAGTLIFVGFAFRPLGRDAAIMAVIFMAVYSPWMIRNYQVCQSPVGLGWYAGLHGIRGTESQLMRSLDVSLDGLSPLTFRAKLQAQTLDQMRGLMDMLGVSVMAMVFFVALLHLFKRPETSSFRWAIFSMWICAVLGMSVFGLTERGGLKANDLHVLFIPLMICYGLAYVLVLWTRLEINIRLARLGFLSVLFFISSLPFIEATIGMLSGPQLKIQWPPYVAPYIGIMGTWTTEKEIIASDMPWAVAWYAERNSLWIPETVQDFVNLNDYKQLKGAIVGLYITPVSANRGFISEIIKGEYKEWAPFITRNVSTKDFPLKVSTPMPYEQECIFYSDRDRWTPKED